MDWRTKVELYEQIRREYEFGVGSIIGVARKLGVHRRMVREAVRNAVPAQRKKTERPAVKMAPAVPLIDAILELDRKAPRKQRHTARRIFDRIRAEIPGCTPAERTVRQYVERRKHILGLAEHETFVPQSYDWGVEAQVDWYEAYADLDGVGKNVRPVERRYGNKVEHEETEVDEERIQKEIDDDFSGSSRRSDAPKLGKFQSEGEDYA